MLLTYEIPEWARDTTEPGMRAVVPFRKSHTVGVIVSKRDDSPVKRIRQITDIPDRKPLFTQKMLKLLIWLANYYASPVGDVFRAALPGGLGIDVDRYVHLESTDIKEPIRNKKGTHIAELLAQRGDIEESDLKRLVGTSGFHRALEVLIAKKIVRINLEVKKTRKPRMVQMARISMDSVDLSNEINDLRAGAVKQEALLRHLIGNFGREFRRRDLSAEFGASPVKAAQEKKWIEIIEREVFRIPPDSARLEPPPPPENLTDAQKRVIDELEKAVRNNQFDPFLLWGITGSGKTEVYLYASKEALSLGKGVIVLVPEIALTPQLWGRFEQRFPGEVAVLHSGLKKGERFDAWRRIASGDLRIVIGPRSAILAPLPNPGLIIVDEEHETSYKQDEPPPYYNARDVAIMRGSIEKCPVVLGSATPSAESYYNARTEKYRLLELPERIPGAELPGVRIVDMTIEREENKNFGAFSRLLSERLLKTTERGHRSMLLLNRRGYSSYLQCPDCGHIPSCPECGIGLTYHRVTNQIICHYCGYQEKAMDICPECGSPNIKYRGTGTQKIEEELLELIPENLIFRLDADSARGKGHGHVLSGFMKTPGAVLVGTQMIAKGHDFPDVALVGVLNADIGLTIPDFRSDERIFQLLTQVAGRAGRSDIRGEVIIQTYRPDSPAIDFAVNGDLTSFFEIEFKQRENLLYPPFSRLVRIIGRSEEPEAVRSSIYRLVRELVRIDPEANKYIPLGPASCPLSKLRGKYRWHLLLKTQRLSKTVSIVERILSSWGGKTEYKVIVDPLNLL